LPTPLPGALARAVKDSAVARSTRTVRIRAGPWNTAMTSLACPQEKRWSGGSLDARVSGNSLPPAHHEPQSCGDGPPWASIPFALAQGEGVYSARRAWEYFACGRPKGLLALPQTACRASRHHQGVRRRESCSQVGSDQLPLTQRFMADILAVRLASVSETARPLRQAGIIHYNRGDLRILDRPGLERSAAAATASQRALRRPVGFTGLTPTPGKRDGLPILPPLLLASSATGLVPRSGEAPRTESARYAVCDAVKALDEGGGEDAAPRNAGRGWAEGMRPHRPPNASNSREDTRWGPQGKSFWLRAAAG
jgi:hypothetical protein